MIRVTRIVGESFDLESGEEKSKAIMLSNGHRELLVHVSDGVIDSLLRMTAEALPPDAPQVPSGNGSGVPQPPAKVLSQEEMDSALETQGTDLDFKTDPVFEDVPAFAPEPEFEAGEEYDDPSTGTPSL